MVGQGDVGDLGPACPHVRGQGHGEDLPLVVLLDDLVDPGHDALGPVLDQLAVGGAVQEVEFGGTVAQPLLNLRILK